MTIEVIMGKVIDGGWYQWLIIAISVLASFFQAWQDLAYTFISVSRTIYCMHPSPHNQSVYFNRTENKSCPEQLIMMNVNNTQTPEEVCSFCESWCYDLSDGRTSVIAEWDLICSKTSLVATIQAAYAVGGVVGSFIYGYIGDRWGRQIAINVSTVNAAVFSIATYFSSNYIVIIVLRFLTAVGIYGQAIVTYVICSEMCTEGVRPMLGSIMMLPYTIGYLALSGIAYLVPLWENIILAVSVPSVSLVLLCLIFIPESIRWLMVNQKEKKALATLTRMAKWNGRKIPPNELEEMIASYSKQLKMQNQGSPELSENVLFLELFRTGELAKRILISYFLWFSISLCYYGMSFNASAFGGTLYFTSALMAADQIAAVFLAALMLRFVYRKVILIFLTTVAGIACLLFIAVPAEYVWGIQLLVVVANLMFASVFAVEQVVTVELFPSTMRNIAFGTCYNFAAVGMLAASYIVILLGEVYVYGPIILFGSFSLACAFVSFFLPETKNAIFPDCVADIKKSNGIIPTASTCTLDSTVF